MTNEHAVAVVAEAEEFFSGGVRAMLKRQVGYKSVLHVETLDELTELLALKVRVDLVVLDLALPGCEGIETVRQLHATWPETRVAVMTDCHDDRVILRLLAAGAQGVIPKDAGNCTAMLAGLQTVSDFGIFVPETAASKVTTNESEALTGLTERQRQVIGLLSRGYPNKVIARELGISPSTVKVHVHAAFRTLGVHNRMAAAAALWPQQPAMALTL